MSSELLYDDDLVLITLTFEDSGINSVNARMLFRSKV